MYLLLERWNLLTPGDRPPRSNMAPHKSNSPVEIGKDADHNEKRDTSKSKNISYPKVAI